MERNEEEEETDEVGTSDRTIAQRDCVAYRMPTRHKRNDNNKQKNNFILTFEFP